MGFIRQFLIYGVSGALSRLVSLLLVPLYTRVLSQDEYGQLEILLALHLLAVLMIGLQGESAVARDFHRAREDGVERELYWGALAITAAGFGLTVVTALVALAAGIPAYIAAVLPLVLYAALAAQVLGIQLTVLRFDRRPMAYSVISICDVAITALASVVLIVVFDLAVGGAIAGLAIGKTVAMVASWQGTFGIPRKIATSRRRIGEMLAYSLPTMPAVVLNWMQTMGTRVIWSFFFAFGGVAVASVGMRVAAAFGIVLYAFRLAWEPFAFRLLESDDEGRDRFSSALGHVALLAFAAACCATLFGPLLTRIFAPPAYQEAAALVGILLMTQVWLAIILVTQMGIHGARVTSRIFVATAASSVVNLTVLATVARSGDLVATAWAQYAGSVVGASVAAWYSNRHFDTGLSYRLLAVLGSVTALVGMVSNRWPAYGATLWPHPYTAGAIAVGVVILWFAGMHAQLRGALVGEYRAAHGGLRRPVGSPAAGTLKASPPVDHQEN